MIMQKKAERRRKRQEMRSAQHIAQQAREATPPDEEMRHAETPPGEPHQHGYARYARQEVDTPPRPQHQSSFAPNHGMWSFLFEIFSGSNFRLLMQHENSVGLAWLLLHVYIQSSG